MFGGLAVNHLVSQLIIHCVESLLQHTDFSISVLDSSCRVGHAIQYPYMVVVVGEFWVLWKAWVVTFPKLAPITQTPMHSPTTLYRRSSRLSSEKALHLVARGWCVAFSLPGNCVQNSPSPSQVKRSVRCVKLELELTSAHRHHRM